MLIVPLYLSLLAAADPAPALRIQAISDAARVEVRASISDPLLPQSSGKLSQEEGERWLLLALIHPTTGQEGLPILGTYERTPTGLRFTPRHPLVQGQRYRAILRLAKGQTVTADYQVPPRATSPPAAVEKIYPSTATLPANHLKFYLHFSKPMRESRDIFDHIHIVDSDGHKVHDPWRRTELWSADAKRLTLWIHPGRVKRGVNLREELGPVLQPKREYALVIGSELLDADEQPLGKPFTKKFRTTEEDRTRPLAEQWRVRPPEADTVQPLVLEFPEPLDRALLERFLKIANDQGQTVRGRIEVGTDEKSWSFHPDQPWKPGVYTVRVDEQLEDLAGNTPLRLFDVDLNEPAPEPAKLTVSFRLRAKSSGSQ